MGFEPFEHQREILEDTHRFKCMALGRQFGKTTLEAADNCCIGCLGGHVWCVAPTYDLADVLFNQCMTFCADGARPFHQFVESINIGRGSKHIRFKSGGLIRPRSSENPKTLVGEALDKISFDEAAKEPNIQVVDKYLSACLSNRQGSLSLISTPEAKNWFYFEWLKGRKGLSRNSEYKSWQYRSIDSPVFGGGGLFGLREWANKKNTLPDLIFRQEYGAEFLADGGMVFRNIDECSTCKTYDSPKPFVRYVMGVDIARVVDWTVITIMEADTRRVAYMERFNQIDWVVQRRRIWELCNRWMCPVLLDSTGPGDVFLSELQHMDFPMGVRGLLFTQPSKSFLVNTLSLAFQNKEIEIPEDGAVLRHELEIFRTERLPGGKLRYSAPTGEHDDACMSLALAYEMCLRHGSRAAAPIETTERHIVNPDNPFGQVDWGNLNANN